MKLWTDYIVYNDSKVLIKKPQLSEIRLFVTQYTDYVELLIV